MAKTKIIMVRVTDEQHAQIEAARGDKTVSGYVRDRALGETKAHADPAWSEWESKLNRWCVDGKDGYNAMVAELGQALTDKVIVLSMDDRAAFLAQELG